MPSAEPFDRRHPRAVNLGGGHQARIDRHAVDQHRARAALSLAAPFLGAGKPAVLAQHVEEALQGMNRDANAFAVKSEAHRQLATLNWQLSTLNWQLSTLSGQLSTLTGQLSTVSAQL